MLLGGCAPYRIGPEKFSSSTAALERQAEIDADLLSHIRPLSSPVGGSVSILVPSERELQRNYIQLRENDLTDRSNSWSVSLAGASWLEGGVPAAVKFALATSGKHFQLVADAIQRRHLFESVSIAFHDGNPGTYSIGEHDFLVFADVDGWFVRGKETPHAQPRSITQDAEPRTSSAISTLLDALEREIDALRAR